MQLDEIYNLGAMSHVRVSFEMSEYTAEADGVDVLRLLNAVRSAGLEKKTRLYQVSRCRSLVLFRACMGRKVYFRLHHSKEVVSHASAESSSPSLPASEEPRLPTDVLFSTR